VKLVSEEAVEPETETDEVKAPEAPGGTPPVRTERGADAGSGGDGGGRRRSAAAQPGFFARTAQFLRDVRAEMRRVSWPSAAMVKNTTIITLVAVVFFAVYLFLVDRVWSFLIGHLRTALGG
jgi:preprotein translocase subunit SecE